jgi:EmrB/QacA subfamily drug resistance transporter
VAAEAPAQPVGLRSLPRKKVMVTFAGVMLAMFLSSLDQTVVGTAMPRIISDLGGFSRYTWVTSVYIITSAVTIPITGKLTDMYGRKFFYIGGLVVFVLSSFLCGLSQTMTQIIIFRGVQGIGAGVMMANAFTVIGDIFPPAERGKYQGFMSGVFGLSSIIGPTLGGYLTDSLSWHWVFFVNIPLGILIIILFIIFFPNFRPDSLKHKIDYPGLSLLILTVVPAMLALSWGGVEYPWSSVQIVGMFIFSAVMLALFIFVESRSQEPIIPLSLFKNRVVAISELVIFFTAFGMFGGIIFVPLFFQGVLGATATTSGSFLTPMMLGNVAGSFISGQLLSRAGGHYKPGPRPWRHLYKVSPQHWKILQCDVLRRCLFVDRGCQFIITISTFKENNHRLQIPKRSLSCTGFMQICKQVGIISPFFRAMNSSSSFQLSQPTKSLPT